MLKLIVSIVCCLLLAGCNTLVRDVNFSPCNTYNDTSLPQVLSCVAVVNGAAQTGDACPFKEVAPLRFSEGSSFHSMPKESRKSLDALACMLKVPELRKLRLTLVGHDDTHNTKVIGSNANYKISLRRAYSVKYALGRRGVAWNRLRVAGSGDTEPLEKATCHGTSSTGASIKFPCERRVDIKISKPLLTRYGAPAVGRAKTRFVDKNVTAVRRLPAGLKPGHAVSIDMSDHFGDLTACQFVRSDYINFNHVTTHADKPAGELAARFRVSGEKLPHQEPRRRVLLDIIGTAWSGPRESNISTISPPYPGYWAAELRLNKSESAPAGMVTLIEKFAADQLSNNEKPKDKRAQDVSGCLGFEPQQDDFAALAHSMVGSVLENLPESGDDRLARVHGFNVWTNSLNLTLGMELCFTGASVLRSSKDKKKSAIGVSENFNAQNCMPLVKERHRKTVGNTPVLAEAAVFQTESRNLLALLPHAQRDYCANIKKNSIYMIDRPSDLACIAPYRSAYRLFFPTNFNSGNSSLKRPVVIAADSKSKANESLADFENLYNEQPNCIGVYDCIYLNFAKNKFDLVSKHNVITTVRTPISTYRNAQSVPVGISVANFLENQTPPGTKWINKQIFVDSADKTLEIDWPVTGLEAFK